jgi:hypothetical protein
MKRLPAKARLSRGRACRASEPRLYCTGFVNPVILSKTLRPLRSLREIISRQARQARQEVFFSHRANRVTENS